MFHAMNYLSGRRIIPTLSRAPSIIPLLWLMKRMDIFSFISNSQLITHAKSVDGEERRWRWFISVSCCEEDNRLTRGVKEEIEMKEFSVRG